MDQATLLRLLEDVKNGLISPKTASAEFARLPFEDIGFAKVDHHRSLRTGLPEVILASGKTPDQVAEIFARIAGGGVDVLATRANAEAFNAVQQRVGAAKYFPVPRVIALRQNKKAAGPTAARIAVVCAGTSDIPVAEEAAVTIEVFGGEVDRIYDIGVAGLHRLLAHREVLQQARAIIVCAGMEGALPSVLGGLVSVPVIAVPTSAGYGASFNGLAALLGMLNSCSPNVAVVNIDNGFGAAYIATMICRGPINSPVK
ncbi:MAG: nickel pincer cofactor biosynthesis protein LarB [Acidobacteriaceae bacterium]